MGWGVIGSAALMNIIADSVAVLFPVFANPLIRGILFFILTAFMILINVFGAKQGVAVVKIITVIKLLPLLGIIIFGFSHIKAANLHLEHLPSLKTFSNTTLILFLLLPALKHRWEQAEKLKILNVLFHLVFVLPE
ncbi:MAG: hypothetical protein WKF59_20215 [Chitinophagaceae bacterium]